MSELQDEIDRLEGEVMFAAFHGYKRPDIEARLVELYAQIDQLTKEPNT